MLKRFRVEESKDTNIVRVPVDVIRRATEAIFRICGLTESSAAVCADVLISNDLRGNDSHGVSNMLRKYTDWYLEGKQNPQPYVKIIRNGKTGSDDHDVSAVSIIDADGGLGIHVGPMAMKLAIQKAKKFGIGCVIVKNAGHLGGAGYHAGLAAKEGCIGQCFGAPGGGLMCPTFGAEPRFGTHPMAWAAPGGKKEADFLFDVATSQVAGNKIRLAARLGVPLAENWITDENGKVIQEELQKVPNKFYMTPMGGTRENSSHKGYGLACVIDILCNTISGIGAGFLTGGGGLLFQAYDIASFCEYEEYQNWIDQFLYGLKTTPPVPECSQESDRVLYPGLYAHEVSENRKKHGIPYHKEVLHWYKSFANLIKERNLEQDRIGVDTISDQKIKSTEYLINLVETEFPTYELTNEEKNHWQSGVFSGVLGQSSMSHGTFKDQSVGKWAKKSSKRVTLLDGGLGRTLCINGLPHGEGTLFRKLWAAAALADEKYHQLIVKAHMDFIEAGSQIITTNSYAVQPNYYSTAYGEDAYEGIMLEHAKLSSELAAQARKKCALDNNVQVFGSLGPIFESHQTKQTKDYINSKGKEFCIETYRKIAQALYDGGANGFLCEAMNCWEEAEVALEGLKRLIEINEKIQELPIFVSMEAALRNDDRVPEPHQLGPIYAQNFLNYINQNPSMKIICFGLNCSAPEDLIQSLRCMFKNQEFENELIRRKIGFVVYANLNDRRKVHSQGFDRSKDNAQYIQMRQDLVENDHAGYVQALEEILQTFKAVTHIGGCCGCRPQGIRSLQKRFL